MNSGNGNTWNKMGNAHNHNDKVGMDRNCMNEMIECRKVWLERKPQQAKRIMIWSMI